MIKGGSAGWSRGANGARASELRGVLFVYGFRARGVLCVLRVRAFSDFMRCGSQGGTM